MWCAPTGAGCAHCWSINRSRPRCARACARAATWSPTGSRWPTSCAPPADLLPRRGRAVRRHRLRHQPALPGTLPHPGPGRLALPEAMDGLAGFGRLQRPHPARHPAPAPHRRAGRRHRPSRRHRRRGHRRVRRGAAHPHHPDRGAGRPHRRATRPAPRQPDLHQPAPLRAASAPPDCSPRSATPAAGSPPPTRWPAWPGWLPPPASPARSKSSPSAGARTDNCATRSATSPATAATPTPGPPTSTAARRARGHDHPHAVRVLARAWVDIIWACWTTNTPYDPAKHGALQRILNQDQPTAA